MTTGKRLAFFDLPTEIRQQILVQTIADEEIFSNIELKISSLKTDLTNTKPIGSRDKKSGWYKTSTRREKKKTPKRATQRAATKKERAIQKREAKKEQDLEIEANNGVIDAVLFKLDWKTLNVSYKENKATSGTK